MRASKGFTLIELAVVIAILVTLASFAALTAGDFSENADAAIVDGLHGSLQAVISQGSARMDLNPTALDKSAVVRAVRTDGQASGSNRAELTAGGGNNYTLTINSGRTATYTVNVQGDVTVTGLTGFSHYGISGDGTIHKL